MHVEPDLPSQQFVITSYSDSHISVNASPHHQSFALTPTAVIGEWHVPSLAALIAEDLDPFIKMKPELILLGTGLKLCFPATHIIQHCHQHRIGLEVMDTPAACRTFNLLASDGRQVIAALILGT